MKKIIILTVFVISVLLISCGKSTSKIKHESKEAAIAKRSFEKTTIDSLGYTETIVTDTLEKGIKKSFYRYYKDGDCEEGYTIYSNQQIPVKFYKFYLSKNSASQFLEEEYDEIGNIVKKISIDFEYESKKLLLYEKSINIWNYQDHSKCNFSFESYDAKDRVINMLNSPDTGESIADDFLIKENIITERGKKQKLNFKGCFKRITEEAFAEFNRFLDIPVG